MKLKKLLAVLMILTFTAGDIAAIAEGVLKLPKSLKTIEEEAFSGDRSIDRVVVPDGTEKIGPRAFADSSLKEIVIPDTVRSIADDAFDGCGSLTVTADENSYAYNWALDMGYIKPDYKPSPAYHFEYTISNGECTITRYTYASYAGDVVVPAEIEGCPVTAIGQNAFNYSIYPTIESIVLPNTVVSIGSGAFSGNSRMVAIRLPGSIRTIGENAFEKCSVLEQVYLPRSLTSIPKQLFKACRKLQKVTMPEGLIEIGEEAFYGCYALEEIAIPGTLNVFSAYAFRDCTALRRVVLEEGIQTIGKLAFLDCESLKDISLPDSLTTIEQGAFAGCKSLERVVIPRGVTSISFGLFQHCSGLRQVELHEGITSLGQHAFTGCSSLESIDIPKGVTTLAEVFSGCKSLRHVVVPEGVTSIANAFSNCTSLESVILPESLTRIDSAAFNGCSALRELPDLKNITYIGASAFAGCAAITSAVIPGSVKTIDGSAFSGCSSLQEVVIHEGLTEFDRNIFKNCTSLNRICIPSTLKKVLYTSTFEKCPDTLTIYCISGSYAEKFAKGEGYRYEVVNSFAPVGNVSFNRWAAGSVHQMSIPEAAEPFTVSWKATNPVEYSWRAMLLDNPPAGTEADYATGTILAEGTGKQNSLSISRSKLVADKYLKIEVNAHGPADSSGFVWTAFVLSDKTDFTWEIVNGGVVITGYTGDAETVTLPGILQDLPVTAIGESAFAGSEVSEWYLPDSIHTIGNYAFENARLTSIRLPENNLLEMGYGCFSKTPNLKSVDLPGGLAILPDGCFSYGGLTSITLPETLLMLGEGAFEGCASLQQLSFTGNVLAEIPDTCFYGCDSLSRVILPDSVRFIGNQAFIRTNGAGTWPSIYIGDSKSTGPNGEMLESLRYWTVYAPDNTQAADEIKRIDALGLSLKYGGNGCFTLFPEGHGYIIKEDEFGLPVTLPHNHEQTFVCKRCADEYTEEIEDAENTCWRCIAKAAMNGTAVLPLESFELLERYSFGGNMYYRFCMLSEVNGIAPDENALESSLFMDANLRPVTDADTLEVLLKTHLYVGSAAKIFESYPNYPTLTERSDRIKSILTDSTNNTAIAEDLLRDDKCREMIGALAMSALRTVWGDPVGGLSQLLDTAKDLASVESLQVVMQITILKEMQVACQNHITFYSDSLKTVRSREGVIICEEAEKSLQAYCNALGVWRLATECNSGIIEEIAACGDDAGVVLHNIYQMMKGAIPSDFTAGKLITFFFDGIAGIVNGDELSVKSLSDKLVELSKILSGKGNNALNVLFKEYKAGSYVLDEVLNLKEAFDEYEKVYASFCNELEDSGLLKIHQQLCS